MKTTINELIKNSNADYWEIYKGRKFHTDYCYCIDWLDADEHVIDRDKEMEIDWEIMDEDRYGSTILANSTVIADFAEWFGDNDAKILCVLIKGDK